GDQQLFRGLQAAAVGTARRPGRGDDDAGDPVRAGVPGGAPPGLHGRRRQRLSARGIATERDSGMAQRSTVPVVREPERVLPVAHTPEVLVVGGGIAGIMAALAAGRSGARTLLVERFGSLGGTGTAAMMSLFYVPYAASRGLVRELFDRLIARGGAIPGEFVVYDAEMYKVTALEMLAEAGVQVLLHTLVGDGIVGE